MSTHLLKESLSCEFQVMLAGLQAHLNTAPTPDWQPLLNQKIDWGHLLELCQYHEVTPLVYASLRKQAEHLRIDTLEGFKQQSLKDKQHSMRLARTLKSVLTLFRAEGIDVLPYKGVILSQQLFGDIATRPTKDLDLVVHKRDYHRAKKVLLEHGFQGPYTGAGQQATPKQEKVLLKTRHHLSFFNPQRLSLELHFRIMPPHKHEDFSFETIWKRTENHTFFNHPIKTMNHEQLLFALSMHATNHYWKRLKWLFDSAILLDRSSLNESFMHTSQRQNIQNVLLANVALCHQLLALPITTKLRDDIAHKPFVGKLVCKTVTRFGDWPHKIPSKLSALLYDLSLSESGKGAKLERILRHVLVGGDSVLPAQFIISLTQMASHARHFLSRP